MKRGVKDRLIRISDADRPRFVFAAARPFPPRPEASSP